MGRRIDITGEKYGRLTAVKRIGLAKKFRVSVWQFQCECGTLCDKFLSSVRSGHTTSCGCFHRERASLRRKATRIYPETKEGARAAWLKRTYDLSAEAYEELLRNQNGRCAICYAEPKNTEYLHVDHSHNSGEVRGLLCSTCNTGLGFFKDNKALLKNAIIYLEMCSEGI